MSSLSMAKGPQIGRAEFLEVKESDQIESGELHNKDRCLKSRHVVFLFENIDFDTPSIDDFWT